MTTDFRVKLQELPAPVPRVELRERILASRATGARVVLPTDRRASRLTAPRAIAAAIVLTILTWGVYSVFVSREEGNPSGAAVFAGSLLWPTPARGQEVGTSDTVGRARYPLLDRVVPSRPLTAGTWSYRATMTTDGLVTTEQGIRTFSIAPTTLYGVRALAIVTYGTGRYAPEGFTDSLVVSQDSLRLLRRTKRYGRYPGGIDFPAEPPRYLSWRDADINWVGSVYRALFQLTPLNSSWRGSVYVPWITYPNRVRALAIDLRVTGSERVTSPAGTYDTWVVSVRFRNDEARVYVSKDRGLVVKIAMPMGEDAVWEQVLAGGSTRRSG